MTPISRILRSAKLAAPVALAAFVALTIAPAATPAATVAATTPEECNSYDARTDWGGVAQTVSVPRFAVPGATLLAANVTRTIEIHSDMKGEIDNNGAIRITGTLNGQANMPAANGLGVLNDAMAEFVDESFPSGAGAVTKRFDEDVISDTRRLTDPASLAFWNGGGSASFTGTAVATREIKSSGNDGISFSTSALMKVCVSYDYSEEILVCVGDYVWIDANKNGIQDAGEQPVVGRNVVVTDTSGRQIGTAVTGADGRWTVCNLEPSLPCIVNVDLPEGYTLALSNQGGNDTTDSDGVANGADASIACMTPPRDKDLSFDVGIVPTDIPFAVQAPRATVLRAAKRSFSRVVKSGGIATFSVTVRNTSSATVRNVSVCDTPPRALTFTKRPKGSFISNGRLCWKVASLAGGRSVTFRYQMRSARVGRQVCVVNRVAANLAGSTSAAARASVCIRPAKIAALPLAG